MVASIRLEGDPSTAQLHVRAAKALLGRVVERREGLGVQTLSGAYRVDESTYIYVLSTGTINIAQVVSTPPAAAPLPYAELEGTDMPVLGGVVYTGLIKQGVEPNTGQRVDLLDTFAPTERTQLDLKLQPGKQRMQLFAVDPYHEDLRAKNPSFFNPDSAFVYSQYTMLKPTMFTGAMKFAVQAVMSYGKQKIKISTKDASPSYMAQVASQGYRVRYDYHFACTHGIVFGTDGEPWLVEISVKNGVLITPLPRFSWSKKRKTKDGGFIWPYRDKCVAQGRTEIVALLDLFGGLPTGEAFPADIAAAVAEGSVLRLIEPENEKFKLFYKCAGYSSALGWAFPDPRAQLDEVTHVHNTGYFLDEENSGAYIGVHYRVAIRIGEYDVTKKPFVGASAEIFKEGEGYLIQGQPVPLFIKFWEPLLNAQYGGLLSVDVYPPPGKGRAFDADCETTMHVFYIGNELNTVKFYHSASFAYWGELVSSAPECPYGWSGISFERHDGATRIDNQFISNHWDKRESVSENSTVSRLESNDMGWNQPFWQDRMDFPDFCDIMRERIFMQKTTTVTKTSEQHRSVVMVPAFMREAFYIAHEILIPDKVTSVSRGFVAIRDPWQGVGFRKLFASDAGPAYGCPEDSKERINLYMQKSVTAPGSCVEQIESGEWLDPCQLVEYFVGEPYNRPPEVDPPVHEEVRTVEAAFYSCSQQPYRALDITWERFENQWMTRSPDPYSGITQFILGTENTFGADSSLVQPDIGAALVYEPPLVAPLGADGNITFVGVVK